MRGGTSLEAYGRASYVGARAAVAQPDGADRTVTGLERDNAADWGAGLRLVMAF
ncbi:MAG: hypothetical protein MI723_10860 [Caulobacterales bacterium]|nr:hypothetical protein [Caulobacterales bacterium]